MPLCNRMLVEQLQNHAAGDAHNRLLKRIQAELLPKRAPAELLQRAEDYAQLAQALAATL